MTLPATPPDTPAHSGLAIPSQHECGPIRIDEALGEDLDKRLNAWLGVVGLLQDRYRRLGTYGLGRFAMLCYPDSPNVDRLLLAAKYLAVLFGVDDHYCDDERQGGEPTLLGERLTLVLAIIDPVHLSAQQAAQFAAAVDADPVLGAWLSFTNDLVKVATPAQVGRVRHEIVNMLLSMAGEASWRMIDKTPRLWEYATNRQFNGALPCTAIIDLVGDYELPADMYYAPEIRRASILAGNAVMIGNDLFSARKEALTRTAAYNLPRLVAAEQTCSSGEGLEQTALIYEEAIRDYREAEKELLKDADAQLSRYLLGLRSWIDGSLEWYLHTARYNP